MLEFFDCHDRSFLYALSNGNENYLRTLTEQELGSLLIDQLQVIDRLQGVQRTALIPLACRAVADSDKDILNYRDAAALELATAMQVDLDRFGGNRATRRAVILRDLWFDNCVVTAQQSAKDESQTLQIINLASGFDTAFYRLRGGLDESTLWLDADLPPVNALKRKCLPTDNRHHIVDFDLNALESSWHDLLEPRASRVLFLASGVLMYFATEHVAAILRHIASQGQNVPCCEFAFDWCSPLLNRFSEHHPGLRRAGIQGHRFQWSVKSIAEFSTTETRFQHIVTQDPIYPHCRWSTQLLALVYKLLCPGRSIYGCTKLRVR